VNAGISPLQVEFLYSEQENLPQRHRGTEKNLKNSVPLCLCGENLFGSGLSSLGDNYPITQLPNYQISELIHNLNQRLVVGLRPGLVFGHERSELCRGGFVRGECESRLR